MSNAIQQIESYEQQLSLITAEIICNTGKLSQTFGGAKNEISVKTGKLIQEAKEFLDHLDVEIRSLEFKERDKYQNRLKSYHVEFNKLQNDFKNASFSKMTDNRNSRDLLFGDEVQSDDTRALLIDNTQKLEKSSRHLDDGFKICLETEQLGSQILEDLSHQRSTLNRARDRLHETNDALGKSSRVLSSMIRRVIQNRFVMVIVCLVVLAIIGISIYFIVKRH